MAKDLLFATGWVTEPRVAYNAAEEFAAVYEPQSNINVVTLDEAPANPSLVQGEQIAGKKVITHSAGAIHLLKGLIQQPEGLVGPEGVLMIAPPLRRSVPSLATEALVQSVNSLLILGHTKEELTNLGIFSAGALMQIITSPYHNLSYLNEIADFDSLHAVASATHSGVHITAVFHDRDPYFRPTKIEQLAALNVGVDLHVLPGEHEAFLISPHTTATRILERMVLPEITSLRTAS
jgi:hypothetical protein